VPRVWAAVSELALWAARPKGGNVCGTGSGAPLAERRRGLLIDVEARDISISKRGHSCTYIWSIAHHEPYPANKKCIGKSDVRICFALITFSVSRFVVLSAGVCGFDFGVCHM
jgi:hypothetical protein